MMTGYPENLGPVSIEAPVAVPVPSPDSQDNLMAMSNSLLGQGFATLDRVIMVSLTIIIYLSRQLRLVSIAFKELTCTSQRVV